MKKYHVFMQDDYNNLYHLGFYNSLEDALPDVNEWLSSYDVHVDEIEEYASTFGPCFDKIIDIDEYEVVYIRGFIFDSDYLKEIA